LNLTIPSKADMLDLARKLRENSLRLWVAFVVWNFQGEPHAP
jgi:hypothetical protein